MVEVDLDNLLAESAEPLARPSRIRAGANKQKNLRQLCEWAKQLGNDLIFVVSLVQRIDDYHSLFALAREGGQQFRRVMCRKLQAGGDQCHYVGKKFVSQVNRDTYRIFGRQCCQSTLAERVAASASLR
jgi:hypothetical protein